MLRRHRSLRTEAQRLAGGIAEEVRLGVRVIVLLSIHSALIFVRLRPVRLPPHRASS